MKIFGLAMVISCTAWFACQGQITVELVLDERQILPGESLPARVEITNRTGQDIRIGAEPDWISFTIESLEGSKQSTTLAAVPPAGETLVKTSLMATHKLNLAPYLDLSEPGRYVITAQLTVPGQDRPFNSKPAGVEIIPGTRVLDRPFGIKKDDKVEKRKYVLNQAAMLKELRLYFRLTDEFERANLKVFSLGSMVSWSRPEALMDGSNHLHVLFQNGARSFAYHEITTTGEIVRRQRHEFSGSKPRLQQSDNGKVQVVGGVRWLAPNDLPPNETEKRTNDSSAK